MSPKTVNRWHTWAGLTPKCEPWITDQIRSNPFGFNSERIEHNAALTNTQIFAWHQVTGVQISRITKATKSLVAQIRSLIGNTTRSVSGPVHAWSDRRMFLWPTTRRVLGLKRERWTIYCDISDIPPPTTINHVRIRSAASATSGACGRSSQCSLCGVQSPSCAPSTRPCYSPSSPELHAVVRGAQACLMAPATRYE